MADGKNTVQSASADLSNPSNLSSSRTALIMVAIAFCALSHGFSMFKLIPMQSAIMNFFQIEVGAYGYLNSAHSWLLIVCAVPIGFLVRKLPSKWGVSIAFVVLLLGSSIQIITTNYVLFVIGRVLEGAGYSMLTLSFNSLTLNMVPQKKVGFWASFLIVMAMVAQIIHTRLATWMMLTKGLSMQQVFMVVAGIQVLCWIFWLIAVPASVRVTGRSSAVKPTKEQTLRIYKTPSVWFVSLSNAFFTLAYVSFNSYIIGFLVIRGMEQGKASTTFSYTTFISIFAMLFYGWLSIKLQTKRKIIIFSFICGVFTLLLLAHLPIELIMIYVVIYGTLPRSIAGLGAASSRDLVEVPADVPIVNSFRETINHICTLIGGIATGYLLQYAGYYITIYVLCGLMAVGAVLWFFAKKVP